LENTQLKKRCNFEHEDDCGSSCFFRFAGMIGKELKGGGKRCPALHLQGLLKPVAHY
jgi:hypothetical protein